MKISKQELLKCSSGEMFGIGNPQLANASNAYV